MCGICGTAGFVDRSLLTRMSAAIAHRGPDDAGEHVCEEAAIALASRRLSILDLSPAGHMPMSNADGTIWITYNGETYNYPELRRDLERRGHRFRSGSDTEVLIHAYEEWGESMVGRLNGIFAFALWDAERCTLLLARDRLGVKPLYWWCDGHRLVFASEVKALLCCGLIPRAVDAPRLHEYLAFLWVPGPETLFEGISKLPPGTVMTWRDGSHEIKPFWEPSFAPGSVHDEAPLREGLRAILERAVRRQLQSDVPVGIFLSGGLDSSGLLALAADVSEEPVSCYTIAFRSEDTAFEQSADDPRYARHMAAHVGARYREIEVAPDIVDLLPKVIWHLDEPVADPAAIATYLISEAARPEVTVLLSGQGADEVFAGYRVHGLHAYARALSRVPRAVRGSVVIPGVEALPRIGAALPGVPLGIALGAHRNLKKVVDGLPLSPEEQYVFYRAYYRDAELHEVYSGEYRERVGAHSAWGKHLAYFAELPKEVDYLNRLLYVDWKTFLPELNLTYSDKLSMAASVESRVPYLDNEIVDYMAKVPVGLKLHGRTSKYLLREALRGRVPDAVLRRRKAGFGAPIRAWLRGDLREMVDDLLSERRLKDRGYFDPRVIRRMIDDDREGRLDSSFRIWALLTLELWHRTFIDQAVT